MPTGSATLDLALAPVVSAGEFGFRDLSAENTRSNAESAMMGELLL